MQPPVRQRGDADPDRAPILCSAALPDLLLWIPAPAAGDCRAREAGWAPVTHPADHRLEERTAISHPAAARLPGAPDAGALDAAAPPSVLAGSPHRRRGPQRLEAGGGPGVGVGLSGGVTDWKLRPGAAEHYRPLDHCGSLCCPSAWSAPISQSGKLRLRERAGSSIAI